MNQTRKFAIEPHTPIVATQWVDWAQALAGRHTHTAARHQRMTLTLAHKQFVFHCARWETNAWTFAPQIRPAITSFLPMPLLENRYENKTRREPDSARTLRKRGMGGEAGQAGRADTFSHSERDSAPQAALNPGSRTVMFVYRNVFAQLQAAESSPLARIAARLERAEATIGVESLVLSRIAQAPRRVEERTPQSPLVLQKSPAAVAEQTPREGREFDSSNLSTARGRGVSPAWEIPAALPINLDQLTDQVARRIDNRITAYRERRGKGV